LSDAELAYIRERGPAIRENVEEVLVGSLSLYTPKGLRDEVASLFAGLSSETTDSYDLRDRLLGLGRGTNRATRAIPAILAEAYGLVSGAPHFAIVTEVLVELGRQERERVRTTPFPPDRALMSIDQFALSSSFGVRQLCRAMCEGLGVFPDVLTASLQRD